MTTTTSRAPRKYTFKPGGQSTLTSPQRFIDRELSWLGFNQRVLEEAANPKHPLLERLRFLSISANNLDEFYMVRVAGLREQVRAGVTRKGLDGRTPAEQLVAVNEMAFGLMNDQQARWQELKAEMKLEDIEVLEAADIGKADKIWLRDHFMSYIFRQAFERSTVDCTCYIDIRFCICCECLA